MAGNKNTAIVQNSRIVIPVSSPALHTQTAAVLSPDYDEHWLNFWYNLRAYLHPSWVSLEPGLVMYTNILTPNASALVWNQQYHVLCEELGLYSNFERELDDVPEFWRTFLPELIDDPQGPVTLAGASLLINGDLTASAGEAVKGEVVSGDSLAAMSSGEKRQALRLNQCLSLSRRFPDLGIAEPVVAGLWFLYKALI